ncbi:type II toxin-antitoxin system HigB family toxin (plasmid) [Deinococcus sp. D7000]|nr:type II toxin-antitoxin system HigB family toxin [Deinococcus sp. D7000]
MGTDDPPPPRLKARIVARPTLRQYMQEHPEAADALKGWERTVTDLSFHSFAELRAQVPSVDYVNDTYLVWNINGNAYRLITLVRWTRPVLYLHRFMTHAEYNTWSDLTRKAKKKKR